MFINRIKQTQMKILEMSLDLSFLHPPIALLNNADEWAFQVAENFIIIMTLVYIFTYIRVRSKLFTRHLASKIGN